jgi:protein-S-isoprenylcysteine O-methyltransferase Ste14
MLLALLALTGIATGGAWSAQVAALTMIGGLVSMIAGSTLVGRGLLDLGRNLTPVPRPRDDAALVESGIYSLVRHPIYGGLIAVAFGWGLFVASPLTLMLAVGLALFFDLKSRREESWLRDRYAGYEAYATRTHRFFPRFY